MRRQSRLGLVDQVEPLVHDAPPEKEVRLPVVALFPGFARVLLHLSGVRLVAAAESDEVFGARE